MTATPIVALNPGTTLASPPLTPDFYQYHWHGLSASRLEDDFVTVVWPDQVELTVYGLWLRENAVGAGGIDPATREALIDPADLPDGETLAQVEVDRDGALSVSFHPDHLNPDGATARFHPGWLRHIADGAHRPSSWLPEMTVWVASDLAEPPTHDGSRALDDPVILEEFAQDLVRYGLARLRSGPCDPNWGLALAQRLGAIRSTNFGEVFDVKTMVNQDGKADTNSVANTNLRLGPHSDLPTRETPPGFQFLHCVENQAVGGYSTMVDGLALIDHLKRDEPEHLEALTSLKWIFFNRGRGIDHRWSGPLIDLGADGKPVTFRAFYPVRAFPDMEPKDIARAYSAMKYLQRVAADPAFELSFPFEPGDMIGFDNRRVLHGRQGFEVGGARHLRGFYVDHDEIYSFVRVAGRHRAGPG